MTPKKIQKMFYYSSEYIKKFIESRIDDIAIKTQRSSSFIIENMLLDGLLPENKEAKDLIQYNLYPVDESGGVQKTLERAFEQNACGLNWKSLHDNFKPLVEYGYNFCSSASQCTGTESQLPHFCSQLRSVVERIENCTESCIEDYDRSMFETQTAWAKVLLSVAEKNPTEIVFRDHFQLVMDCWDMLKDWQITYRYLADLVAMSEWQENPTARNYLFDVINDISKEW